MAFLTTTFSAYNQRPENGALPRLVWRHLGPRSAHCAGAIAKTTYGTWSGSVTNRQNRTRHFEAKHFRTIKAEIREFMEQ
jgi:hypothetical protein